MKELIEKAWRIINSCHTPEQAKNAMRWIELLGEQYPQIDVGPLKRELRLLFDGVA